MLNKGKSKVTDNAEVEQSCKFKADPLVLKASLEIEVKKRQLDRRIMQRQREKHKLEEVERELLELKQKLEKQQELWRREKEAQ